MMNVIHTQGSSTLARVYVAELSDGARVEFVESIQPPVPREEKWVLIVSTLKGCPVDCPMCDAGGSYGGKLTAEEIVGQVEHMILARFPDRRIPVPKLKVQFARMGDPAFNDAVLDALELLPERLEAPGLMPSISTVAPFGRERFFERLIDIKRRLYAGGRFQMQFSLHTTCFESRRRLVPLKTWTLEQMAAYGDRLFEPGDRKITLNFAAAVGLPLEPATLRPLFDPNTFLIKLTPINPTVSSIEAGLVGRVDPRDPEGNRRLVEQFTAAGYETILSIGELEENRIGSNCGMYVKKLGSS